MAKEVTVGLLLTVAFTWLATLLFTPAPAPRATDCRDLPLLQHERTRRAFEQMIRNIDARQEPEQLPYPGYVEQDAKTVTLRIGDKVIVAEWYDTVGWNNGNPLTEAELNRRWRERDGTVFKIVPKGQLP